MVQNYAEWKEAVNKEDRRLSDVRDYLNNYGMDRLKAFRTLNELTYFCQTASELLEEIRTSKKDKDMKKALESAHALGPIKRLEWIVENNPT